MNITSFGLNNISKILSNEKFIKKISNYFVVIEKPFFEINVFKQICYFDEINNNIHLMEFLNFYNIFLSNNQNKFLN